MGESKEKQKDDDVTEVDFPELQKRIERKLLGDIKTADPLKRSQYITDYYHFVSACQVSMLTERQRAIDPNAIPMQRGGSGLVIPR